MEGYRRPSNNKTVTINSTTIFSFFLIDFDFYLAGYSESDLQTIRHIRLIVERRSVLMEYIMNILECNLLDIPIVIIQQDNQLAEAVARQLRDEGFWSMNITGQTMLESAINIDNVNNTSEQLNGCFTTFQCLVTTMKFLRDCPNAFKMRPSVVINFDPIPPYISYLKRWLNYRATKGTLHADASPPQGNKKEEIFLYQICFPSSDEF